MYLSKNRNIDAWQSIENHPRYTIIRIYIETKYHI